MDIDWIHESGGKFLVFEVKRCGQEVSLGQRILLERLSKLPQFTVVVLWLRDGASLTQVEKSARIVGGRMEAPRRCTFEGLRKSLRKWRVEVAHAAYVDDEGEKQWELD